MAERVYRRTALGYEALFVFGQHRLSVAQRYLLQVLEEDTRSGLLRHLLPQPEQQIQEWLSSFIEQGFVESTSYAETGR